MSMKAKSPVDETRNGYGGIPHLRESGRASASACQNCFGREMSRIMLAMKSIFARHDQIPVLIFDEVDTGVSGRAAQSIAEAVLLAKTCQVFSITHLPQVACMADHQYLIEKKLEASRTMTQVENLNEEGRVKSLHGCLAESKSPKRRFIMPKKCSIWRQRKRLPERLWVND